MGVVESLTKFSKGIRGGGGESRLDKISVFRGGLLVKRVVTLAGGCSFYIKNKLKYEIFNDKKSI